MPRQQRLVFGEVAELYDRVRPSYPAKLVDDVLSRLPPGPREALEIGAGTGKATVLFAQRGLRVLALEPSAEMAAVAARNLPAADVEIVHCDFERFDARDRRFALVFSAQAWHWIDPVVRARRAADVLVAEGVVAAFWNRPLWPEGAPWAEMEEAYGRMAPQLLPADAPNPLTRDAEALWDAWRAEAEQCALNRPEFLTYEWRMDFTRESYLDLLRTQSPHRLLEPALRETLLDELGAVIDRHGGRLSQPQLTWLCLARRPPD